ncbi:MAG: hypothetical protein GY822_25785 [Deltaproteobacteria bacterium]|nr:hypothetical protein [Deltaproteobacteria bacterium]
MSTPIPMPPQKRGRELLSEEVVVGVFRVYEVFAQSLDSVFEPFNVTRQQFNVLRILYVRDEPLTNVQIAALFLNRVPDVPRLLERLLKWTTSNAAKARPTNARPFRHSRKKASGSSKKLTSTWSRN